MLNLASIFQSGMVLQREKVGHIWGMTGPGEKVSLDILGQHIEGQADVEGRFSIEYEPLNATKSADVVVRAGNEAVVLEDVAVGEVWIAGGQSNMEFHMRYERNLEDIKPECNNSHIRFFDVPEIAFEEQKKAFDYSKMGIWRKANPEDIEYFSAVGYYFAADLYKDLEVPVGIIGCNWGGTIAAAWMNPNTVKSVGPEWMKDYENFAAKVDWENYYKRQLSGPINDRGNLFADPFSEFIMPKTPSMAEIGEFFEKMRGFFEPPAIDEPLPCNIPGALYEHMLKTIAPISARGVLWYQGESDDEFNRAHLYEKMLTGLIYDWRTLFKDESLSFIIVQLPGFESWLQSQNNRYDLIRKAQQEVTKKVANTYLCSASDMGEQFDIHPKNKKPIGERMALLARGHVYGEDVLCDAPEMENVEVKDGAIEISFSNVGEGLVLEGDEINSLKILDNNKNIAFTHKIVDNKLVLQSNVNVLNEKIKIEFAQEKFYIVNLYNSSHIPVVPFEISL